VGDREEVAVDNTASALTTDSLALYGGSDPAEKPRYTFPEAARATGIPTSTVRSWIVGQTYPRKDDYGFFEPVIERSSPDDTRLSFTNLIELHVLRALRTVHEVRLGSIREAVTIAETECDVRRLLISPDLRTFAGELFLDSYANLVELSRSRQIVLKAVLEQFLARVEYNEAKLPFEFYPFERSPRNRGARVILLSPYLSFGRPVLRRRGVSTRAVVERLDAGEEQSVVAEDYQITDAELEEAILYEAAA